MNPAIRDTAELGRSGNDGCVMWIKRHMCELVGLYLHLIELRPLTVLSPGNKDSETKMLLNYESSLFIC